MITITYTAFSEIFHINVPDKFIKQAIRFGGKATNKYPSLVGLECSVHFQDEHSARKYWDYLERNGIFASLTKPIH